ncbi:MAG: O-antigen ligase family protein [Candidatus Eisenbacteria bacterium]
MKDALARGRSKGLEHERGLSVLVLLTTALLLACFKVRAVLIPVLAVAGTLFVALLVLHPLVSTGVLAFLAYGDVSSAFLPGAFSVVLMLGFVAWIARSLLSSDFTISATKVDLALGVYLAALLVSMLFSTSPEAGGRELLLVAKWLAFYVLLVNTVRDRKAVVTVSAALVLGAALSGVVALWVFSRETMMSIFGAVFRAAGLAGNPNELAIVMVTVLPISVYMIAVTKRRSTRLLFAAATMVLVAANFTTLARTGLLAMLLVFAMIAVSERRRTWTRVVLVVFLVAFPLVIPKGFWLRFAASGVLGTDYSAAVRAGAMRAGASMIAENPVTGAGLGMYLAKSTQYGDIIFPLVAHNMFLHVTAECGLLGLSAMLFLIATSFSAMGAAEKLTSRSSQLFHLIRAHRMAYVAYLVCGLFTSIQFNQSFWYMPAASVFLLQAARSEARESRPT